MGPNIPPHQQPDPETVRDEVRYRDLIRQHAEGIWRFECAEPIPIDLSEDQQIDAFYRFNYLAECNDAMARMYGCESAKELIGKRLGDLLIRSDPKNDDFHRAFIRSGYRLTDAESHERDCFGNDRYFSNNLIGIIESGRLVGVWGTQRDVTQLRQAMDALRTSEARNAAVLRSALDAIITLDQRGAIIEWNPKAEEIFRLTSAQARGRQLTDFIAVHNPSAYRESLERNVHGEADSLIGNMLEMTLVRQDGERFAGEMAITRVPRIEPPTFCAYVRDNTKRRLAEQALSESEQRFALFMRHLPGAAFIKDGQGRVIFVNEAHKKIMGWHGDEWKGKTSAELFPPQCAEQFTAHDERVLQTGEPLKAIEQIPHGPTMHHYLVSKFPIPVGNGNKPMLGGVAIDFEDLRRAEETVRYQKTLLESVNEASHDGLLVVSPTGKWLSFNHRFLEMWKISPEMAGGGSDEEVVRFVQAQLKDPEEFTRRISHLYENPYEVALEERLELSDGRVFSRNSSPVSDPDGTLYGRVWFFHDRSEEESARQRLREMAAQLTVSEERERHRIASVLHDDITQILAISQMKLHGVERTAKDPAAVAEIIRLIAEAIERSRVLTVELSPPVLYEEGLLPAIEWLTTRMSARSGIALTFHSEGAIAEGLPEETSVLLFQAVRELLTDMTKHSKATRGEVQILRRHDALAITVRDNGIGFDEAEMKRGRDQNNSFGLFSIQERIKALGGRLHWHSRPGAGAEFTLYLRLL